MFRGQALGGCYDTGDIVGLDAEGYLHILGRMKRFAKPAKVAYAWPWPSLVTKLTLIAPNCKPKNFGRQATACGAGVDDQFCMRLDSTTPLETAYRVKDAML